MNRPDLTPVDVIGLGNPFRGDDAFGPAVISALRDGWTFPAAVRLVDAGTPGLDLLTILSGTGHVLLVDAVAGGAAPGTVRTFRKEELLRLPPSRLVSGHALDLAETLRLLDLAGPAPGSVTLIGVEPESVEAGRPMSPAVRAAVPEAVHAVLARLEEIGVGAVPRGGVR